MNFPRRRFARLAAGLLAGLTAFGASAQGTYPDHPIRFVVGYPAGQAVDMMARTYGVAMGKELGTSVVVDNKAGANGILGAQDVKGSRADGYTVLAGTSGQLAINPTLYKKLPYDTLKDFATIGVMGKAPVVLIANPSFAAKNVADLIKMAKATPGKLDFGSGGSGITAHLAMELFQDAAGIKLNHVPYKGSPAALNDLMGGQIPLMMEPLVTALPHIKAGKVKALAITSPQRSPVLPDVPTIAESGFKDFEVSAWSCLVVPAGTPPEVVAKLAGAMRKAGQSPAVMQALQAAGLEPVPYTPAEFRTFLEAEVKKWGRAVQVSGAQVD